MKLAPLVGAALVLATAAPALAKDPPKSTTTTERDPMRCKHMPVTGSLVGTKKVCMSESEWRQAREDAQSLNDNKICTGASCAGAPGPT